MKVINECQINKKRVSVFVIFFVVFVSFFSFVYSDDKILLNSNNEKRNYNFLIDEVKIYNIALDDDEIQKLYEGNLHSK